MSNVVSFSLLSGAFGAIAASLAKLAFSQDTFLVTATRQACHSATTTTIETESVCHMAVLASSRALCFVGTLALNIFMVGSFLEGMEESGSVAGTGLASAANFVVSSVLGFLLWEEHFSTDWLLGFSLVIVGSLLLSTVKAGTKRKANEKEE